MNQTDPTASRRPMSRAEKAEALLLHFTAEAHRRKWHYDRGLNDDGVPIKSEAFDALHRLGEDMRTALEELRQMPAAVSAVVSPPTDRAELRKAAAEALFEHWDVHGNDADLADDFDCCADAVLAVLGEPTDRAAVLREAAEKLHAQAQHLTGEFNDSDILHEDGPAATVATWKRAADVLRRLAVEAHGAGAQQQPARCPHGCDVTHCPCLACEAAEVGPDRCSGCRYVPCENCDAAGAQQQPDTGHVRHSGPDTKFCVLCQSGEHERVDEVQKQPDISDVEERVALHLAANDWLPEKDTANAWDKRSPEFREDYLAYAREVIAIVRDTPAALPAPVVQQPAAAPCGRLDSIPTLCSAGDHCCKGPQQPAAADDEETPSRAVLLDLVRDFLDADPCSFDHHGYCQAHGWLGGEPGSCPHGRARKLIPGIDDEETPQLPHDEYIGAVADLLTAYGLQPGRYWTETPDGAQLDAVLTDFPATQINTDQWPHCVYLAWDQHTGWQLIENGGGRNVDPLDPSAVRTYSSPQQVAYSAANALRGRLSSGPITNDGSWSWDPRPLQAAVAEWEADA